MKVQNRQETLKSNTNRDISNIKITNEENVTKLNLDISACNDKTDEYHKINNKTININVNKLENKIKLDKSMVNTRLNNYITSNDKLVSGLSNKYTTINEKQTLIDLSLSVLNINLQSQEQEPESEP